MNEIPFSDIREESDLATVRTLVHAGWMVLEIYKRKAEVRYSQPTEWEEYPVYVLGDPQGG